MDSFVLDVRQDIKQVERYLTDAQKKVVPRAAARALNRAGTKVVSIGAREVSKKIGLKQKRVKEKVTLAVRASTGQLLVVVVARGKPINIIDFVAPSKRRVGAFKKKKGVVAKPYGKSKTFVGTFIGHGQNSSKLLVLTREQKKQKGRLPVKAKAGPSIPNTFKQIEILQAIRAEAEKVWKVEFPRQMKYYLSRIK